MCAQATFTGYHVHGGYAEYALVSETVGLSDPFNVQQCMNRLRYSAQALSAIGLSAEVRSKPGQRLGLYGFGASAHITIQVARHWGCSVYVCSLREEHRQLAKQLGAAWVGGAAEITS